MTTTNDHLLAVLVVGSDYEKQLAEAELTRRGVDVARLRRDYLPQFMADDERPRQVAQPRSRQRHHSSLQMVTRQRPDGEIETAVSLTFDSEYTDW